MVAISEIVETALNGRVVSQVPENQQLINISVGLQESARSNLDAIRAIPISTPTGQLISLGDVANVEYGTGANVVNREDVSRLIVVSANVADRLNLPLALVGGIVSIVLTGGVISVASLVGFITLFGVAVRNGLLLVDNYNNKFAQGMPLKDVIIKGSLERIDAILMTALTSALGTLPLVLSTGAGNEILQPLAIVVLGGYLPPRH